MTQTNGFDAALSGITVELYDLDVNNPKLGTAINVNSFKILQHSGVLFGGLNATATGVFDISLPSPDYKSLDLRVVIKRSGITIVDESLNYNFEVFGPPLAPSGLTILPNAAAEPIYKELKPGGYIFIPPLKSSINNFLPKDGSPPNYTDLKNAIKAVLNAEGQSNFDIDISLLDKNQCRHIAREIIWDNKDNYPPRPHKKERKLFTLSSQDEDDVDEDLVQARDQFESKLKSFYSENNSKAEKPSKIYLGVSMCY